MFRTACDYRHVCSCCLCLHRLAGAPRTPSPSAQPEAEAIDRRRQKVPNLRSGRHRKRAAQGFQVIKGIRIISKHKMDVDLMVMKESNTDKTGIDKAANDNEPVAKDDRKNNDRRDPVMDDKVSLKIVKEASKVDGVLDKELLEAFRYFDKNRVGYIKVQDLRCILHNLGKFMCNRHVKELAQSALLESNSARDDRVFYKKLVKLDVQ